MRRDGFERFYYEKVGLGEGCGCAEYVTRLRDLDALAARGNVYAGRRQARPRLPPWLGRLLLHITKARKERPRAHEKGARVAGSPELS
jgi:hypothetical protein